jgi:hypothetical protein
MIAQAGALIQHVPRKQLPLNTRSQRELARTLLLRTSRVCRVVHSREPRIPCTGRGTGSGPSVSHTTTCYTHKMMPRVCTQGAGRAGREGTERWTWERGKKNTPPPPCNRGGASQPTSTILERPLSPMALSSKANRSRGKVQDRRALPNATAPGVPMRLRHKSMTRTVDPGTDREPINRSQALHSTGQKKRAHREATV